MVVGAFFNPATRLSAMAQYGGAGGRRAVSKLSKKKYRPQQSRRGVKMINGKPHYTLAKDGKTKLKNPVSAQNADKRAGLMKGAQARNSAADSTKRQAAKLKKAIDLQNTARREAMQRGRGTKAALEDRLGPRWREPAAQANAKTRALRGLIQDFSAGRAIPGKGASHDDLMKTFLKYRQSYASKAAKAGDEVISLTKHRPTTKASKAATAAAKKAGPRKPVKAAAIKTAELTRSNKYINRLDKKVGIGRDGLLARKSAARQLNKLYSAPKELRDRLVRAADTNSMATARNTLKKMIQDKNKRTPGAKPLTAAKLDAEVLKQLKHIFD